MSKSQGPLLHQDWHHLGFLHWRVPANELQQLLPAGLKIDTFQGNAYVGLIPFTITNSRPIIAPAIPGVSSFHEVNVRTYVLHEGRAGVLFFSLDASSRAAVIGARTGYRLPYHFARISMEIEETTRGVRYSSERRWPKPVPATCALRYAIDDRPAEPSKPGTIEHFLIERYTLYTSDQNRLYSATVEHEPYPVQRADVQQVEETLIWAAGIRKSEEPPLVHYSRGVSVDINRLVRCGP